MIRVLIAGILGGLIVFAWSAASHMLLPIGEAGFHVDAPPDEQRLLDALGRTLDEGGMYLLPGMNPDLTGRTRQQEVAEKWKAGPAAFLVYHPAGRDTMDPMNMVSEAVTNIIGAIILACVLICISKPYLCRVILAGMLGVFAWIAVDASHWIWFGFDSAYTIAQGIDHLAGWSLAGLVVAAIARCPCAVSAES